MKNKDEIPGSNTKDDKSEYVHNDQPQNNHHNADPSKEFKSSKTDNDEISNKNSELIQKNKSKNQVAQKSDNKDITNKHQASNDV